MNADPLPRFTPTNPFFRSRIPFVASRPSCSSPKLSPSRFAFAQNKGEAGAVGVGRKRGSSTIDESPLSPLRASTLIPKRPRLFLKGNSQRQEVASIRGLGNMDTTMEVGSIQEELDNPPDISISTSTPPITMPPSPPTSISSSPRRTGSPTSLPTPLSMRRANKLSLSLAINLPSPPETASSSASTICPSPTNSWSTMSSSNDTPYTPGPPRTPALAMSVGRKGLGRPSLLSLITQPPTNDRMGSSSTADRHPFATLPRSRPRSHTADEEQPFKIPRDPRHSRSALPSLTVFKPVDESPDNGLAALGYALPTASPSCSSSSQRSSTASTPSSSPPLPASEGRVAEPYEDGPVEILPGIYLGAEDSMYHWPAWSAPGATVRVLNVAQEVDHAFEPDRKGKGRATVDEYTAEGRTVRYAHLKWSHGEQGLAEMPGAKLSDLLEPQEVGEKETWKFWEAIRWMEQGRRRGEAVLIHCQCGVSRSATLSIAYIMALAASGAMPEYQRHLKGMQDAYDFVKSKSGWVGPNVSLVFQLVEFARSLTDLLTAHLAIDPSISQRTGWPSAQQAALTEDEWARQRREFEEDAEREMDLTGGVDTPTLLSPEDVRSEADMLDKAMRDRRRERVSPLRLAL